MKHAFTLAFTALCLAAGAQTVTQTDSNLTLDLSSKNWGANPLYQTKISEEKTPGGEAALELTIPAGGKQDILIIGDNTKFAELAKTLPADWEEFSFQYKSLGPDTKMTILFQTLGPDGKIILSNCFPSFTGEWKTMTLKKGMQWTNNPKVGTKLDKLTAITFAAGRKDAEQKVLIGPMHFKKLPAPDPESL